ncbi:DUF4377 domain-containing protein [Adhaeribacter aquaticus]|uniref:DUF4377 domain-containing protein n=1 Tax=Adhaeribacter aquaticus TaxID=299567 RepID=UPI00042561E6|nr:DUF4377 domain-containing protein [Adhaeribacter aquaticus]
MKNLLFLFCLVGALLSCKKETSEIFAKEVTLRVNSYRQNCQGEGVLNCYLVQDGKKIGTQNWDLFYNEIEGFDYEEGFIYDLKVRKENVPNPPADGSSFKYKLIKILNKQKV